MTEPIGGMRDMLIWRSVCKHFERGLDQLGWFDAIAALPSGTGAPVERPAITWSESRIVDYERVPVNTITMSLGDTDSTDLETGSYGKILDTDVWIEFYASDDELGIMVAGDLLSMAQGLMGTIGYDTPHVPVIDWREPEPPEEPLFYIELTEAAKVHGGQNPAYPHMRHWYGVTFGISEART